MVYHEKLARVPAFGYNEKAIRIAFLPIHRNTHTQTHMVQVIQQDGQQWKDERAKKTTGVLKQMEEKGIEQEAATLAARLSMPYADLQIFPVNPEDARLISEEISRQYHIAIFERAGAHVKAAIADPEDEVSLTYLRTLAEEKEWSLELYVVSEASLEKVWIIYKTAPLLENLDLRRVSLKGDDLKRFEENFGELLKLKESANVPVSQTIEVILAGANKLRASDIHIEPAEEATRLRYRIDGVLQEIGFIPNNVYRLTLSRVKMLAGMKINIRDAAQDGHFGIDLDGKKVDLRVNIIPGNHGENMNMRILNSESVLLDPQVIGITGQTLEKITEALAKPLGMIINTGPTGSGKTTTLYSLLSQVNKPDAKIITIEDPIEYQIPGIVQTEVSKDKTYTFGQALRAVVRQDPDVVLVGEIRDEETADVAINAALTGHLLLSTIHANSAPGAVPRFIEMGVKPSLIASALNIVIGQRLVRKLCEHCRESYVPADETVKSLKKLLSIISPKAKIDIPAELPELWKPVGCTECNFVGYRGRVGIFEVFSVTKKIEEIILDLGTEKDILRAALEDGMVTMTQDGLLKAIKGITTIEEVWRVADQREVLKEMYAELMPNSLSNAAIIPRETTKAALDHLSSIQDFSAYAKTLSQSELLRAIFIAAASLRANDVHIEPEENRVLVRFRIDGILQTITDFPLNILPSILGEIKLWSGLKSSERSGVTDGRFSLLFEDEDASQAARRFDVRLSLILGGYGETAVMRLLAGSKENLSLEKLNIRKENLEKILAATKKPNGIILNTGPTGSGKTTTLYSVLSEMNNPEIKIITVEDPIEYRLEGILQTQVNESEGYTFGLALRALLRQDPDIIRIGEIRDEETAQIAVQAANTGHLVLSSLHANSAASAIPRFLSLGVSGSDLANAGNAFIAQRLVRSLCGSCKKEDVPNEEEKVMIDRILGHLPKTYDTTKLDRSKLWRPVGCEACSGIGYSGRMTISEVLPITKTMGELISREPIASEIEDAAREEGMITIAQDGILSVLEGKTTIDEIRRVTDE